MENYNDSTIGLGAKTKKQNRSKKLLIAALVLLGVSAITVPAVLYITSYRQQKQTIHNKDFTISLKTTENNTLKEENKAISLENSSLKTSVNNIKAEADKLTKQNTALSENVTSLEALKDKSFKVINDYYVAIEDLKVFYRKTATELATSTELRNMYGTQQAYEMMMTKYHDLIAYLEGPESTNIAVLTQNDTEKIQYNAEINKFMINLNDRYEAFLNSYASLNHLSIEKIKELQIQVLDLKAKISSLESQVTNLNRTIDNNNITIEKDAQKIDSLIAENKDLKEKIRDLNTQLVSITHERDELKVSLANKQSKIDRLNTQITDLKSQLKELEKNNLANLEKINTLNIAIANKQVEYANANLANSKLLATKNNLDQKIAGLEKEKTELNNTITSKNSEIGSLNNSLDAAKSENSRLATRINNLSREKDSLNNLYLSSKNAYANEIVSAKINTMNLMATQIDNFANVFNSGNLYFDNNSSNKYFGYGLSESEIKDILSNHDEEVDKVMIQKLGLNNYQSTSAENALIRIFSIIKSNYVRDTGHWYKDNLNGYIETYNSIVHSANYNKLKKMTLFKDKTNRKNRGTPTH